MHVTLDQPITDTDANLSTMRVISLGDARRLAHRAGILPKGHEIFALRTIDECHQRMIAAFLASEMGMLIDPNCKSEIDERDLDAASRKKVSAQMRAALSPLLTAEGESRA